MADGRDYGGTRWDEQARGGAGGWVPASGTHPSRELGAELEFQQLFQEMDVQRFLKSVQTRTVTAVRTGLRDAGYGTGAYDARANFLFDHSAHVSGTVNGNVQTGHNARAHHRTVTAPQPQVGPDPTRRAT